MVAAAISRIALAGMLERLERRSIDQRDIIDLEEAGIDQLLLGRGQRRRRPARRRRIASRAAFQRDRQRQRQLALVLPTDRRCATTGRGRRRRARSATPTISTGEPRSAAIRRITASCWKSFSPNRATSGATASSSLATTVATPSKWPGRCFAFPPLGHAGDADRRWQSRRDRYPRPAAATAGRSPPARAAARPPPPAADSGSRSRWSPNCSGIDEDRRHHPVGALLAPSATSVKMPGMERAHGRHQAPRRPPPQSAQRLCQFFTADERFARDSAPR